MALNLWVRNGIMVYHQAQNLGFNAIGIEKEKEYCYIAEERLKNSNIQLKMDFD